uniref:C1q domain-containing protein n=1 Tax=Magallana gigas TaxID=29159 RepID=A0A8W8M4K8_MAGGI
MRTFVFFSLIFATGQAVALEDETIRNILNELNTLKTIVAEQQSKIQLLEKKLESVSEQNRKTEFNFNTDPEVLREKMNPSQTKVPETFKKAPVSGLYVFFYDIECSKTNGNTYVELVRDGARTGVQAYCHGLGDFDNSATLGVLHLGAGDTVWLRLYDVDNITFGGKTLFSGFLL